MADTTPLDRRHPFSVVLRDWAANGHLPTSAQVLSLLERDLPAGHSLTRMLRDVVAAAEEVYTIGQLGDHAGARRRADEHLDRYAAELTDPERAVVGDANPEDLGAIAERMFRR